MFDRDSKLAASAPKLVLVREAVTALKVRTGMKTGGKVTSAACSDN